MVLWMTLSNDLGKNKGERGELHKHKDIFLCRINLIKVCIPLYKVWNIFNGKSIKV